MPLETKLFFHFATFSICFWNGACKRRYFCNSCNFFYGMELIFYTFEWDSLYKTQTVCSLWQYIHGIVTFWKVSLRNLCSFNNFFFGIIIVWQGLSKTKRLPVLQLFYVESSHFEWVSSKTNFCTFCHCIKLSFEKVPPKTKLGPFCNYFCGIIIVWKNLLKNILPVLQIYYVELLYF